MRLRRPLIFLHLVRKKWNKGADLWPMKVSGVGAGDLS
jgi:hypothetical protein